MLSRIIGLLLIILLLPLFIVISLIIVLDDGFPIIFIQKRIGKNKKTFNIYKFRTMKKNTKNIATHLMEREDSVILKSGHFIRKYSIDELPQAINIVFGNMNFIGPRPALYNQKKLIQLRDRYNINNIKPGITGWAQVNGRDSLSSEEKVKYDYQYIKNKNLKLNLLILYRTLTNVFSKKNVSD